MTATAKQYDLLRIVRFGVFELCPEMVVLVKGAPTDYAAKPISLSYLALNCLWDRSR